ncbi:MAG: hypothetical protein ACRDOP_05795 [Gaiellaceae bacterium]
MALERDPVQSYRERVPAPEIARKVASVWVLEVGAEGGAYEHRTAPNGSVEISYELGSDRDRPADSHGGPAASTSWRRTFTSHPRQLHRRFVAALGFGPKTLERILRLQGFLALAQGPDQRHIGLARLVQRAGYADQPHLTREVAALAGVTPRVLLEETRRSCGPNHDHEASYAGVRRAPDGTMTIRNRAAVPPALLLIARAVSRAG